MTVRELIDELSRFDGELTVRYKYDGGYSYPTFQRVYQVQKDDEISEAQPFVCLDEDAE